MSNRINDGGPAFPRAGFVSEMEHNVAEYENKPEQGMSLRDWLAGQIAGGDAASGSGWDSDIYEDTIEIRARFYYKVADAMIKARRAKL